jgi:hypothetical protein
MMVEASGMGKVLVFVNGEVVVAHHLLTFQSGSSRSSGIREP